MTKSEVAEKLFGAAWADLADACARGDRPAAEKVAAELLAILNRRGGTWDRGDLVAVLGRRCVYLPPAMAELENELRERRQATEDTRLADLVF
ncbi:MAG: hypothetical protein LBU64_13065 [Planctomycetota bacterium]|jgi:hypothetical protein|nr:hypothetical protein [Planctomycetota bacterium]